jgi:superoxide dismutase, Fe-Mn family
MTFIEKKFNLPKLSGISDKTTEEHLKLYAGYVKHANLIESKIKDLATDFDGNQYIIGELKRRLGFEFDGMRNHEYYFEQFEGGYTLSNSESFFSKKVSSDFGSLEGWIDGFKKLAMTRGVGWAMLYYDKHTDKLIQTWVEEQHIGHLTGLDVILALDMWEHSYMLDYVPSEKKKYIEACFENINWSIVEKRIDTATSSR